MDNELIWHFPTTDGGDEEGVKDNLQETFEGDYEFYVARETVQNSIDARDDYTKPVRVRFEHLEVSPAAIPGLDGLKDVIYRAMSYAGGPEGPGSVYLPAIEAIESEKMSILKISDFNTKGLLGGDEKSDGASWYKLVRATGDNQMTGAGGGSFGIGKGAPFAASILRTVYYATKNIEGESIFQGKARLSSYSNEEGDVRHGIGQLGIREEGRKGVASVRNESDIPEMFHRDEVGTDVYVMGYKTIQENWKELLIKSLLNNFWAAVHFDDLVIELVSDESEDEINKDNLASYLSEYSSGREGSLQYYEAVTSPLEVFREDVPIIGESTLYVAIGQDLPKRVQMMRKAKMVVSNPNYRVMTSGYAAVFICENEEGNCKLRDLEPPAHDKWDPSRDKINGKAIVRQLEAWIKEKLRSLASDDTDVPEDIPGVSDYLPEVEERDDLREYRGLEGERTYEEGADESPVEFGASSEQRPTPSSSEQKKEVEIVTTGDVGQKPVTREGTKHIDRPGTGGGGTGEGDTPRIDTSVIDFKAREVIVDGEKLYQVNLLPGEDTSGSIRLMAVGDDADYPIDIQGATYNGVDLEVEGATVKGLVLRKNEASRVLIKLKHHRRYKLGVESHEG